MPAWLIILIAIAVFIGLLLFLKWVLDVTWNHAGKTIEKRHRTMYRIMESGKVPSSWAYRRSKAPDDDRTDTGMKRRALKRLAGEMKYFENAAPFETLEAKRIFMYTVRKVEKTWRDTPAESFMEIVDSVAKKAEDHEPGTPYTG